jgi:hypothetical protein
MNQDDRLWVATLYTKPPVMQDDGWQFQDGTGFGPAKMNTLILRLVSIFQHKLAEQMYSKEVDRYEPFAKSFSVMFTPWHPDNGKGCCNG